MMAKTYIPEAVDKAGDLAKYFGRWSAKMSIGASTDQLLALAKLTACLAEFLQVWFKPVPTE